ncbi:recombination mediator RecR [Chitinophaga nivalis]|uniref:Recombination protein RecR n=1 Tax=Chitinophaga nivalis TaxID=2991709 RepID=A0ABT3IVN7_9BACT|nr:recombination mediator RecR [Chitinophaga nivalis]MCW3462264.1 recombination mediator RecR [Chitinophaga nivalis]MCW3488044.1 recombination mediator RecR [Chitinophaga nivalis]
MVFSSALIENAVNEFSRLPGIGKKTALRLVLHLLKQEPAQVQQFGDVIARMRQQIKFCKVCHNVADEEVCSICSNHSRQRQVVCVVENIRDVMAIENTQQFNGLYHVLGGIISPIDGIGPDQLNIHSLVERVRLQGVEEVIMAVSPTIEGDTTIYYLSKKLREFPVKITTIARGIAFGGELEYADEMTLARSISNRLPLEKYVQQQ